MYTCQRIWCFGIDDGGVWLSVGLLCSESAQRSFGGLQFSFIEQSCPNQFLHINHYLLNLMYLRVAWNTDYIHSYCENYVACGESMKRCVSLAAILSCFSCYWQL